MTETAGGDAKRGRWAALSVAAEAFRAAGSPERAEPLLRRLVAELPHALWPKYRLAATLYERAPEEALALFESLWHADNAVAGAAQYAGQLHESRGRYAEAEVWFRRAIEAAPANTCAAVGLAHARAHLGELAWALSLLERLTAENPGWHSTWTTLGHVALMANDPARSAGAYERALRLDPERTGFATELGDAYYRLGRFDEAARWMAIALERDPRDVPALIGLGTSRAFTGGDAAEAKALLDRAVQASGGHAHALAMSGHLRFRLGDVDEARRLLRSAIATDPSYALSYAFLGAIELEAGDLEEALAHYTHVSRLGAASTEILIQMARTATMLGREDAFKEAHEQVAARDAHLGDLLREQHRLAASAAAAAPTDGKRPRRPRQSKKRP